MFNIRVYVADFFAQLRRELETPPPPFRASKRTATIMNGLWYGKLTPRGARTLAEKWGFDSDDINTMILTCTQPPSYWSRHTPPDEDIGEPIG